ncbi:MAG: hypothetical protein E7630_02095 [Ruminococcaceae bacterium]|nr:hypothetical protein [Oscillospiraceae bacterium]
MRKEHVGKTCPYCKTPLVEGDTVVFCSVCDMPHHLSCWQDNQGCTTFGCTGSIKEIIENDSVAAAAPAAPQPTPAPVVAPKPVQAVPAKQVPAPAQVEQTEKPIETLYESKEMVFMSDVPLVLENAAIIIDRTKDKLFARCTFRSITDKLIKAVLIEINCQDVWGSTLGEPIAFQYLDLKTKRESKFGQTNPIDLPDKTTRKIQVAVKKVLFADDSVTSGGGAAFTMSAPVLLSKHLGSDALAAEYARETSPKAQFVLETSNEFWRCACGALNTGAEEKCYNCGCTKKQLTAALNPEVLNANMVSFAEAKRAAAERAQAEQAERIRLAEEQVRLEQARKEQDFKIAENLERKKKRRKKTVTAIIISLVIVALLGCGTVFFGIPYYHYHMACEAFDNGEYDTAYQTFVDLGDFMDSEDMALKSKYEKAKSLLTSKNYESAYTLFNELGSYKDADEKLTDCIYSWADKVLSRGKKAEANKFKSTVSLKSEHYSTIYSKIWAKINNNTKFDYWDDYWNDTEQATVVYTMLQMLPSSYEETATLNKLFKVLSNGDIHPVADYIRNNKTFLKTVWSIDFIQDFLQSDDMISCFLEGYWSTYSGDYYINFYESDGGGTSSEYNLPWVSEPYGTKYYDIRSLIYIYTNEDSKELAKVYRFEIVDYDTIKVFCYKNNRTYTLYRD